MSGKYKYTDQTKLVFIVSMVVLVTGAIVVVGPFLWMLLTSLKTYEESTSINPFVIIPGKIRFDAYITITNFYNYGRLYFNTITLIILRIFCGVVTSCMAGYAFGRLNFFGKPFFFALVLVQMMVPGQIFVLPQYLMIVKLKALNTMFALLFPGLITTFGTFLMRQAFKSLPSSIEESAKVDGANPLQIFTFIMLPMVNSGMVALGIFTALFAYKELLWPLVVNTANYAMPLSSALAKLQGQSITYFPDLMAAATLGSIPMIVIYIIFQKRFIQGIATTGLKL
jgi:multiple sugar transport system permease protein